MTDVSDTFSSIPFRILEIISEEGITSAAFADKVGISRGAINHYKNGRNGPNRNVIAKILEKYPEINSDWLLSGKLPKYKTEKTISQPDIFAKPPVALPKPPKVQEEKKYAPEI